jgi:hypothetical protein
LNPQTGKKGLRFGVMCSGYEFQTWQAEAIARLLADGNQAELLIIDDNPFTHRSFLSKVYHYPWKTFLYSLCQRYFFRPPAKKITSMKTVLAHLPVIRCRTVNKGYSQYFTPSDIGIIRSFNLDFILRFGFSIIRGEILEVAAFGIWSFHHDDERKYRGGPPGFWEIYYDDPVSGSVLQRLTSALDAGIILYSGFYRTITHSYSATLDRILSGTSGWPAAVARAVVHARNIGTGDDNLPDTLKWKTSATGAPVCRAPRNMKMLRFLLKLFVNKVAFHYGDLIRSEKWNVAMTRGTMDDILSGQFTFKATWLPSPPAGTYYADPFVTQKNRLMHIVCEDYNYRRARGVLVHIMVDPSTGRILEKKILLSEGWHMSYPFLISHENRFYCIPESAACGKVTAYLLDELTGTLTQHGHLIEDMDAVDPTLFHYGGLWWLMFTRKQLSDTCLYAWYSTEPFSGFRPHHNNPVKTDVRSSRPAGTPFIFNGEMYRPAQDCSATYGGGVVINRIIRLNPDEFEEEATGIIRPAGGKNRRPQRDGSSNGYDGYTRCLTVVDMGKRYRKGLHTVNFSGDYIIFDGKCYVCDWHAFRRRMRQKIINLFR